MTTVGAIVLFGPLSVTVVLAFLVALPGLAWSPFAALIAWRLARRRGLSGGRYALVGAAYSVFLLVPWLYLAVSLLGRRPPGFVVQLIYRLLYFAWLVGPIVFWGQYMAGIGVLWLDFIWGGDTSEILDHDRRLVVYSVWSTMILMWIGSGVMSLGKWESDNDVTDHALMSVRFITPFALAWLCTLAALGYLIL